MPTDRNETKESYTGELGKGPPLERPLSVTEILSNEQIQMLRDAYAENRDQVIKDARNAVKAPFPFGGEAMAVLGDHFFKLEGETAPLHPKDRERCIIGILAATSMDPGFLLAVHLYWGLVEGLEPNEIAETILLASLYSGVAHWVNSILEFKTLLNLLQNMIAEATKSGNALVQLNPHLVTDRIRHNFVFVPLAQMEKLNGLVVDANKAKASGDLDRSG